MIKTFIYVCLFTITFQATSKDLKTKDDVRAFATEVMNIVAQGKVADGLAKFKPYIIIPESEFTVSLEQVKLQQPMIDQRFGQTVGVELIDIEEQGESLMLIVYIQKFEKHVMRWKMYFYKPKDKWILNTYSTDDQLQLMFSY